MSKRNGSNQIMRNVRLTIILLSISYTTLASKNNEWKSSEPLLNSYREFNSGPKNTDAVQCVYYIREWLGGALNVNKIVAPKSKKYLIDPRSLTWEERAYRYRVGAKGNREKHTDHTYYCSLNNELHVAVTEELIKQPLQRVNSVQSIQNWTFDALKTVCPEYVKNT